MRDSSALAVFGPGALALACLCGAAWGAGCLDVDPSGKRFQCSSQGPGAGECSGPQKESAAEGGSEQVPCRGAGCEAACTSSCVEGGGTAAGGSAGGGAVDGGSSAKPDGGSSAKPDGGAPQPFWERLIAPQASAFHAVSARAMNDVYVTASDGALYHFDGTGFTEVFRASTPVPLKGVWVTPGGAVFAAGDKLLLSCPANCTRTDRFTQTSVVGTVAAVCGLGEQDLFAVGDDANGNGVLHRWNGAAWASPLATSTKTNASCWVSPTKQVFIGARSKILRFTGAGFVDEPIDYGTLTDADITSHVWRSVFGQGDQLFACGYRMRIVGRSTSGQWSFAFNRSAIVDCWAMAGPSADELYAAGEYSDFTQVPHFVSKKGSVWDYVPTEKSPPFTVYGMWASPNGSYFAVGEDEGQKVGAIYRFVVP